MPGPSKTTYVSFPSLPPATLVHFEKYRDLSKNPAYRAQLKELSKSGNEEECAICLNELRDTKADEAKKGYLMTQFCPKPHFFHYHCLEQTHSAIQRGEAANTFDCPSCRNPLDERIFRKITAEDAELADKIQKVAEEEGLASVEKRIRKCFTKRKANLFQDYPATLSTAARLFIDQDAFKCLENLGKKIKLKDLDDLGIYPETFLDHAATKLANKSLEYLLTQEFDPNGYEEKRPLITCMQKANVIGLAILLSNGADPQKCENDGTSALPAFMKEKMHSQGEAREKLEEKEIPLINELLKDPRFKWSKKVPHFSDPMIRTTNGNMVAQYGSETSIQFMLQNSGFQEQTTDELLSSGLYRAAFLNENETAFRSVFEETSKLHHSKIFETKGLLNQVVSDIATTHFEKGLDRVTLLLKLRSDLIKADQLPSKETSIRMTFVTLGAKFTKMTDTFRRLYDILSRDLREHVEPDKVCEYKSILVKSYIKAHEGDDQTPAFYGLFDRATLNAIDDHTLTTPLHLALYKYKGEEDVDKRLVSELLTRGALWDIQGKNPTPDSQETCSARELARSLDLDIEIFSTPTRDR